MVHTFVSRICYTLLATFKTLQTEIVYPFGNEVCRFFNGRDYCCHYN